MGSLQRMLLSCAGTNIWACKGLLEHKWFSGSQEDVLGTPTAAALSTGPLLLSRLASRTGAEPEASRTTPINPSNEEETLANVLSSRSCPRRAVHVAEQPPRHHLHHRPLPPHALPRARPLAPPLQAPASSPFPLDLDFHHLRGVRRQPPRRLTQLRLRHQGPREGGSFPRSIFRDRPRGPRRSPRRHSPLHSQRAQRSHRAHPPSCPPLGRRNWSRDLPYPLRLPHHLFALLPRPQISQLPSRHFLCPLPPPPDHHRHQRVRTPRRARSHRRPLLLPFHHHAVSRHRRSTLLDRLAPRRQISRIRASSLLPIPSAR